MIQAINDFKFYPSTLKVDNYSAHIEGMLSLTQASPAAHFVLRYEKQYRPSEVQLNDAISVVDIDNSVYKSLYFIDIDDIDLKTLRNVNIEYDFSAIIKKFRELISKEQQDQLRQQIERRSREYDNHPIVQLQQHFDSGELSISRDDFAKGTGSDISIEIIFNHVNSGCGLSIEVSMRNGKYKLDANYKYVGVYKKVAGLLKKIEAVKDDFISTANYEAEAADARLKKIAELSAKWDMPVYNITKSSFINTLQKTFSTKHFLIGDVITRAEKQFDTDKGWAVVFNLDKAGYITVVEYVFALTAELHSMFVQKVFENSSATADLINQHRLIDITRSCKFTKDKFLEVVNFIKSNATPVDLFASAYPELLK